MAYRERPSVIDRGVVWTVTPEPGGGRVLPDGCMDLLWLDDDLVIAGPDTRAYVSTPEQPRAVTGIRLAGGAGASAFGVPAYEVRDRRVRVSDVWGPHAARALRARMASAADKGGELERIVGARLESQPVDPLMPVIDELARRGASVSSIAAVTELSERQLRRRAHAAFGYGAKTLSRIHRFQKALALTGHGVSAAEAAAESGYADQAHLAREVRALAGVPLSGLLS